MSTAVIVLLVLGAIAALVGVVVVFAWSAVGGTRQYLQSAKTGEAKNTVAAISRQAVQAYEGQTTVQEGAKETFTHRLCGSAEPVPKVVPAGRKYQPSWVDGQDFSAGDQNNGWKCLKFAMTDPIYFKYEYRQGGDYKGPSRGGPDPGPNGFEITAEGDLDGDGKTSLFIQVGTVNEASRSVKLSELVIIDGDE